jgi:GNAT superfamily N-acetyltransferase
VDAPAVADLLARYDAQLRDRVPDRLPPGVEVERDGPVTRFMGMKGHGYVVYRDLGGLEGADLDDLIARQVEVFGARGERFEWKLHGHDWPADLPDRLRIAGFVPEDLETVVIAPVALVAGPPVLPAAVSLREVTDRHDFDRIVAMEEAVWHDDHGFLADMLEEERAVDPEAIAIVVAEAAAEVVCAAWVRFEGGTAFATLWGGATLPAWRGRGIYRATVAYRANLAAERGFRLLEVDASADSRPILERLGFVAATTTTPFVWSPS